MDAARREAAALEAEAREGVRLIHERATQARSEAEARKAAAVAEAGEEALRVRAAADAYAEETQADAKRAAREIIAEAHGAARDVLHDGTTLSGHLQELSDSLHRNAERLLNDVKLAHARLTADLIKLRRRAESTRRRERRGGMARRRSPPGLRPSRRR